MPKVFVAGLFHETHTFLDSRTTLADFEILHGEKLLQCQGDSSPMGGALEKFAELGWEVVPGPDFRAVPSGTVDDGVIEAFWSSFRREWDDSVDAVFLVLHGAMVSESVLDVEGEMLGRIRRLTETPIFGVYDLHANFSRAMARCADGLIAYRENPHIDAREAAGRAVELLSSGQRMQTVFRAAGQVWAPTETGTSDEPMRSLEARARQLEKEYDSVRAVNVNAGFAFADTPDTGVSFSIVTDSVHEAEPLLDELVELANKAKPQGSPALSAEDAMQFVMANPIEGLTVLTEPSDNIGGGAPGDGTGLLRAMVAADLESAAVCICDPGAVTELSPLDPGNRTLLGIGGRGSRFDQGPIELDVVLVSRSEGRFELEDKHSHLASMSGDIFEMGPCAVVRSGGIVILLTSERTPPFDLGQWRSQGIELHELKFIAVKAAVAHRRAYSAVASREIAVDTPGPCSSDLSRFDFHHAKARINRV